MLNLRAFRKALKYAKKIEVTEILHKDTFSVKKAIFDTKTKEFVFLDAGGNKGIDFVINQHEISSITRENAPADKFIFWLNIKGGEQYRIKFSA